MIPPNENLKFFLVNQMQSFAGVILNTMLDKRFYNESTAYLKEIGGSSITAVCRKELIQVTSSALRNELWALKVETSFRGRVLQASLSGLKLRNVFLTLSDQTTCPVLDSNGRLQTGLLSGSLFNSFGNYEQCLGVSKQQQSLTQGTIYCVAKIELSQEAHQLSLITDQQEAYYRTGRLAKLGLCVPGSCGPGDISALANHIFSASLSSALTTEQVDCSQGERDSIALPEIGLSFVLSLALIVSLVALCISATILGTVQDAGRANRSAKLIDWLVSTFSLSEGWKRLTRLRQGRSGSHTTAPSSNRQLVECLGLLDGLRVISMLWIITIHSYNFGIQWLQFDNVYQVDNIYTTFWIQWVANGTFSVDNFFLIGGLLATFKHLSSSGTKLARQSDGSRRKLSDPQPSKSISWRQTTAGEKPKPRNRFRDEIANALFLCLRRYLRLAPAMMIIILLSVGLLPHAAYGPNWREATTMFDSWCRTGWYQNLLMVQNLVPTPNKCLGHSWYVAVDWQLFAAVQLVFLAIGWSRSEISSSGGYNLFKRFAETISISLLQSLKWLLVCSIVLAQLAVAVIIYQNQLVSIPLVPTHSPEASIKYYTLIYIKPYYWLPSYFIGCLTAICLHSILIGKPASRQTTRISWRRWLSAGRVQLASLALMAALILSALPYFRARNLRMSSFEAAFYALLSRPIWSLCLATTLILAALHSSTNQLNATTSNTNQKSNLATSFIHFILSGSLWLPFSRLTYLAYLLHPVLMATFYGSRTETFQFSHWLLLYFVIGNIVLTYIVALVLYLFIEIPIQVTIKRVEGHYLIDNKQSIRETVTGLTLS